MDKTLAGRTALVTGSTSGIGLGIALLYAEAGARVMLNGFGKPEEIAQARAEVGAAMGGGRGALFRRRPVEAGGSAADGRTMPRPRSARSISW